MSVAPRPETHRAGQAKAKARALWARPGRPAVGREVDRVGCVGCAATSPSVRWCFQFMRNETPRGERARPGDHRACSSAGRATEDGGHAVTGEGRGDTRGEPSSRCPRRARPTLRLCCCLASPLAVRGERRRLPATRYR